MWFRGYSTPNKARPIFKNSLTQRKVVPMLTLILPTPIHTSPPGPRLATNLTCMASLQAAAENTAIAPHLAWISPFPTSDHTTPGAKES